MKNRRIYLSVILSLVGLIVWIGIGILAQNAEAWDSSYYYIIGLPLMCVASSIAGFLEPENPAVFGIAVVILQPIALLLQSEIGPLFIAGVLFFLFFATFTVGSAYLGAALRKKRISGSEN